MHLNNILTSTLEIIIAIACICWLAVLVSSLIFARRRRRVKLTEPGVVWPKVTLMKPVYGLEKNLHENLRTACLQDYPDYQVLYSVQRRDDPAIPLLWSLQKEFGSERVTVAIEHVEVGLNGKINNLAGALPHARHDVLVISDSDVYLRPEYLKTIVAPLADPNVGAVSTFFKASHAGPWYERMELLTINTDHFAMSIMAHILRIYDFCFGASIALRRSTLERIGGCEALGDYLVEDHELGRRILACGKKLVTLDYIVEMMVDLPNAKHWWQKQIYWDQNTRSAKPAVFAATLLLRLIPIGLLLYAVRSEDEVGLLVLLGATGLRLVTAGCVLGVTLGDWKMLRNLWMIPIKDLLALAWFVLSFTKRTVMWRGNEMRLTRDGRLVRLRSGLAA